MIPLATVLSVPLSKPVTFSTNGSRSVGVVPPGHSMACVGLSIEFEMKLPTTSPLLLIISGNGVNFRVARLAEEGRGAGPGGLHEGRLRARPRTAPVPKISPLLLMPNTSVSAPAIVPALISVSL